MSVDRVLIEIMTQANMAGVTKANTGFAGLIGNVAGAAVVLGGLYEVTKDMIAISEEHQKAENNLAGAVADSGRTITPTVESVKAYKKALGDLAAAQKGTYIPATQLSQIQVMRLQDAEKKVADTTGTKRIAAQRRLAELQVQYGASVHGASVHVGNLAAAEAKVAAARAAMGPTLKLQKLNLVDVQLGLQSFMQTNRDFIGNQNEVTDSYAKLIREGVRGKDLSALMTTALHIQAAEGGSLADAVTKVQQAEVGRNRGLTTAVGLTLEAIKPADTYAEKQAKIERNLKRVAAAYKDVKLTPLTVASNHLQTAWEKLAEKDGPGLVQAETDLVNYATDHLIPSFESTSGAVDGIGKSVDELIARPSWQALYNVLFGSPGPILVPGGPLDRLWQWAGGHGLISPVLTAPGNFHPTVSGAGAPTNLHLNPAASSGAGTPVTLHVANATIVTPHAHAIITKSAIRQSDRSLR